MTPDDAAPRAPRGRALSAGALAQSLGGVVEGDAERLVDGLCGLVEATARDLSFCSGERYVEDLRATCAGIVLATSECVQLAGRSRGPTYIVVADPFVAYARAAEEFAFPASTPRGVHRTAILGARVVLGDGAAIDAYAVIGDDVAIGACSTIGAGAVVEQGVMMGRDVSVGPRVVICEGTRIGDRVRVLAGAILGSEGFGFVRDGELHRKIPQRGILIVEDDVEIGANTAIARGASGPTRIRRGTKIDNLVQIGHNVSVGERCLLAGQAGVAGSSVLEDDVVLAGQVGVADHLRVGRGVVAAAQTGIVGNIEAGTTVSGYPAIPHGLARRVYAVRKRLPELLHRITALEDAVRRFSKTPTPE
jgi:UDP-3-O-[3-hydroxymyristoyl] glucosamine N-acyltransferase